MAVYAHLKTNTVSENQCGLYNMKAAINYDIMRKEGGVPFPMMYLHTDHTPTQLTWTGNPTNHAPILVNVDRPIFICFDI